MMIISSYHHKFKFQLCQFQAKT